MNSHIPPLCRLPPEALDNITYHAVNPLGPPKEIVPFLQTCRYINGALSFYQPDDRPPPVYSRIFRFQFDSSAVERRFGSGAAVSSAFARQLKENWLTLKRLRKGDIFSETLEQDFCVPIDIDTAPLPHTLRTPNGFYPPYRLSHPLITKHTRYGLSFNIVLPPISHSAKLLYMSRSEATPYIVPDNIPANHNDAVAQGINWVIATREDFEEFNAHKAATPLSQGNWDNHDEEDPLSGQLDADWHRWTRCVNPWDTRPLAASYVLGTMDGLWYGRMLLPDPVLFFRVVMGAEFVPHQPPMIISPISLNLREYHCISPEVPVVVGGNVNNSSDDGLCNAWLGPAELSERDGRLRIEDQRTGRTHYYALYKPGKPSIHNEMTCTMCTGRREQEQKEELEREERRQRARAGVEQVEEDSTRVEADADPSPSAAIQGGGMDDLDLLNVQTEMSAALGISIDSMLVSELDDDGSGYNTCTGVQDIIIVGETLPRHGQAWHHYRFYGRVRAWDSLIALVRKPIHDPTLGIQIFRGYVHGGQTLVGNWRAYTVNPGALPLEGPFIASRIERPATQGPPPAPISAVPIP
ncbi:hypothetical protein EW026_g1315 [Hermanssonia centrifuga]|uniref:Uncharacterized protein n=1 Tax=Hermanssonia centrifuga TaxID=98765 RepID=A0A4S4KRV4_9APHY|nr:hypothetical protein EW026_g1315 [Hermanssonia centrifuga]